MEASALSVLPNSKIPKEDLEAFYDYCKENPQAKEAVDKVIKAFSPDKIQTFLENCEDIPLPTNATSWEKFSAQYEQEIKQQKEAPKQEVAVVKYDSAVAEDKTVVVEDKTVVAGNNVEKQEISAKRQEILTILTP